MLLSWPASETTISSPGLRVAEMASARLCRRTDVLGPIAARPVAAAFAARQGVGGKRGRGQIDLAPQSHKRMLALLLVMRW